MIMTSNEVLRCAMTKCDTLLRRMNESTRLAGSLLRVIIVHILWGREHIQKLLIVI